MAKLRWGSATPNDPEAARERLIDAAESCFRRYGLIKTTVEDVASAAEVSRATVYRYFADRDELILAVLLREADRFLERLQRRVAQQPDLGQALVAGVLYTMKSVGADENLALLFAPEAVGTTTTIAGASAALFAITGSFLRPIFEAARERGELRPDLDIDDASEWLMRVILSLLTVKGPKARSRAETAKFLEDLLLPSLLVRGPATPNRDGERPGAASLTSHLEA